MCQYTSISHAGEAVFGSQDSKRLSRVFEAGSLFRSIECDFLPTKRGFGLDRILAKCEDLLVHVISRKAIREFARKHPDAGPALDAWFKLTSKAHRRNLDDVKACFPHADLAGDCTVFNVGGNKYRVVTIIIYAVQRVYIRFVMTHAEYNKERWKRDCGC